ASRAVTEEYAFRSEPGRTALLEREIIVTGDSVANASQNFDETGQPEVNITLDARGGNIMSRVTSDAVRRRMAVLFVERKLHQDAAAQQAINPETGERAAPRAYTEKSIISLATIQTTLGSNFRITGLDSVAEA